MVATGQPGFPAQSSAACESGQDKLRLTPRASPFSLSRLPFAIFRLRDQLPCGNSGLATERCYSEVTAVGSWS